MSNRRKQKSVVAVPDVTPQQQISPARGIRVSEAAHYIGASVNFIRTLIREREIPALLLGKRHILLREDLDNYLDLQRRRA